MIFEDASFFPLRLGSISQRRFVLSKTALFMVKPVTNVVARGGRGAEVF